MNAARDQMNRRTAMQDRTGVRVIDTGVEMAVSGVKGDLLRMCVVVMAQCVSMGECSTGNA